MNNQIIAEASIDVNEAPRQAENAQQTADSAKSLAGTANKNISNINAPEYLSPLEKLQLKIQMDNFATIYAADKDIATAEGIDFTAYGTAYQAYLAYMTPLVADMTTYSPIVRSTFNNMVTAVQAEQKRFSTATQAQYNQQIKQAQTDIDDGQTKYQALQSDAETMKSSVAGLADTTSRAISSAGFASDAASAASQAATTASQAASSAVASAMSAESNASSAVSIADSTASEFGPVKQKADSAVASAMSAESDASAAVTQATSAIADSKDAKQIAGAVSQSYKTLTDGSTMTIAELQNGLAAKLTKTDLDGYATQTWTQNKIKVTADDISGNLSSVKSTVDNHTTSINDLKADSHGFKNQFTTVTKTLGKQTTDIGTLQTDSKGFKAQFQTVNDTIGKNNGKLTTLQGNFDLSSKQLSTTMSKVDSMASGGGTNLISNSANTMTINGDTEHYKILYYNLAPGTWTFSSSAKYTQGSATAVSVLVYDSGHKNAIIPNNTVNIVNGRLTTTFTITDSAAKELLVYAGDNGYVSTAGNILQIDHYQLETGIVAHDWSPAPEDNATVTALTKVKQTADSVQVLANDNKGDLAKLQVTAKGLQSTVKDKVSSDQLTLLSGQLTSKISSLSSTTSSQFTQLKDDINLRVKKGDVVNQLNIDAGGILLDTSGSTAKIIVSSNNIELDSANPVVMGSANITNLLTSKTIEASSITSTTKIISSDIQGAMIHSADNSFMLDGDKGSIIGATITSTDNSWSISPTGKITGADVYAGGTYTYVASGSGNTVTGAIYNELNSNGYHQWTDANDHVRINNGTIGITNDAHEKANVDSVDGIPTGVLISDGQSQFTGNVSITNNLQVGNLYTNGYHTINSMDGGAVFLENGVSSGNNMVDFHAGAVFTKGLQTNNLGMSNGHIISSFDGGGIYVEDTYHGGGNMVDLHVKKLYQSSLLSLKTDIKPIDPNTALETINNTDFMSYHFKNDKSNEPISVSPILDDVNPIPKYNTPDIFKSANGDSRNDGNILGYTALAVKALYAKVQNLNSRLQKLEGAN